MSTNTWEQAAQPAALKFRDTANFVIRTPILWATVALFLLSLLLAPGSVSRTGIDALLPFAAIMALAAVGQTLVIMLKGIDLSVPGVVTVGAVVTTQFTAESGSFISALLLVLVIAVVVGVVNGVIVSYFSVSPLVVTLAMNAILMGAMLAYSGGTPTRAPKGLSDFAVEKTLSISNTVWTVLLLVVIVSVLVTKTVWGRRIVGVGSNDVAARAAGIRFNLVQISGYVVAAVLYAAAGVLLAGFLNTPNSAVGAPYLLPVIAAVVLGGTSLLGGRGRIWGSVLGALFLGQLTQLVLSIGAPSSTQYIVQALVIFVAVSVSTARAGNSLRWPKPWKKS